MYAAKQHQLTHMCYLAVRFLSVHALCVGMNSLFTHVFTSQPWPLLPSCRYKLLPSVCRHLPHPHCREHQSGYYKTNSLSISMVTSCVCLLDHHSRRHGVLSSCHNHSVRRCTLSHAFMFQQSKEVLYKITWLASLCCTHRVVNWFKVCVWMCLQHLVHTYVPGLVHFDVKWHWVHTSAGPWSLFGTVCLLQHTTAGVCFKWIPLEIPLCTISTCPVIGWIEQLTYLHMSHIMCSSRPCSLLYWKPWECLVQRARLGNV